MKELVKLWLVVKVAGEIPDLKFGDTYRVPDNIFWKYLNEGKIFYRKKK
ncbi:hypothetical protein [Effusibacillus lacus]|uniref:Uncharacterized protein n=1 Tax=Effusibacillus lacus TaxID=1348429 RepID=A0A292YS66_9BACL|nr:hypothetical protein [Effusibacillus lacus]TCS76935.1 hypothetical protein EDD64_101159 [Effusibacillus lacus]GAX91264.1 hypothetical protein EFBL_2930 [Effusibacillus lacus]